MAQSLGDVGMATNHAAGYLTSTAKWTISKARVWKKRSWSEGCCSVEIEIYCVLSFSPPATRAVMSSSWVGVEEQIHFSVEAKLWPCLVSHFAIPLFSLFSSRKTREFQPKILRSDDGLWVRVRLRQHYALRTILFQVIFRHSFWAFFPSLVQAERGLITIGIVIYTGRFAHSVAAFTKRLHFSAANTNYLPDIHSTM